MGGVKAICIETEFSRFIKRDLVDCALISLDEAKALLESSTDGSFFVTLDVFHDRIKDFLGIVRKHSSKIVLLSLGSGKLRRFYRRFLGDPLYRLANTDCVVGLFINKDGPSSGVKQINVKLRFEELLRVFSIKTPRAFGSIIVRSTRLIKFLIVGLSGFIVNLLSAYALRSIFTRFLEIDLATMIASAISVELSITWNYTWHELWTFSDVERDEGLLPYVVRWVKYNFGSIGSVLTQLSSVYLLTVLYGKPLYLSLTIGVILGFTINYIYSRTIVWRKKGG